MNVNFWNFTGNSFWNEREFNVPRHWGLDQLISPEKTLISFWVGASNENWHPASPGRWDDGGSSLFRNLGPFGVALAASASTRSAFREASLLDIWRVTIWRSRASSRKSLIVRRTRPHFFGNGAGFQKPKKKNQKNQPRKVNTKLSVFNRVSENLFF